MVAEQSIGGVNCCSLRLWYEKAFQQYTIPSVLARISIAVITKSTQEERVYLTYIF